MSNQAQDGVELPLELDSLFQSSDSSKEQRVAEVVSQIIVLKQVESKLASFVKSSGFADEESFFTAVSEVDFSFMEKLGEVLVADCLKDEDAVITRVQELITRDSEGIYMDVDEFDRCEELETLVEDLNELLGVPEGELAQKIALLMAPSSPPDRELEGAFEEICVMLDCAPDQALKQLKQLIDGREQASQTSAALTECKTENRKLKADIDTLRLELAAQQTRGVEQAISSDEYLQLCEELRVALRIDASDDILEKVRNLKHDADQRLQSLAEAAQCQTVSNWSGIEAAVREMRQQVLVFERVKAEVSALPQEVSRLKAEIGEHRSVLLEYTNQVGSQFALLYSVLSKQESACEPAFPPELCQIVREIATECASHARCSAENAETALEDVAGRLGLCAEQVSQYEHVVSFAFQDLAAFKEDLRLSNEDNERLKGAFADQEQVCEALRDRIDTIEEEEECLYDEFGCSFSDSAEIREFWDQLAAQEEKPCVGTWPVIDLKVTAEMVSENLKQHSDAALAHIQRKKYAILKSVGRELKEVEGVVKLVEEQEIEIKDERRRLAQMSSTISKLSTDSKMLSKAENRTGNAAREVKQLQDRLFYCKQQLQEAQATRRTDGDVGESHPQLMRNCANKALASVVSIREQLLAIYKMLNVSSQEEAISVLKRLPALELRCDREYSDVSAIHGGESLTGLDRSRADRLKLIKEHDVQKSGL